MKHFGKLTALSVMVSLIIFSLCYAQNDLEESYHKGMDYAIQGKYEKAKKKFEEALKINSLYPPAKLELKVIEAVVNQRIDSKAAVHFFKGTNYENKGLYDQAISAYTKFIDLNPGYTEAYRSRGRTSLALANHNQESAPIKRSLYEQAISDFDKIIEMNPGHAKAYGSRGFAYMKLGNNDRACADWERACELGRCASYNIAARKGMCE